MVWNVWLNTSVLSFYIKVDNYRYRNPNYTLRQTYYYSLQRFYYTNKEYFDSLAK